MTVHVYQGTTDVEVSAYKYWIKWPYMYIKAQRMSKLVRISIESNDRTCISRHNRCRS